MRHFEYSFLLVSFFFKQNFPKRSIDAHTSCGLSFGRGSLAFYAYELM